MSPTTTPPTNLYPPTYGLGLRDLNQYFIRSDTGYFYVVGQYANRWSDNEAEATPMWRWQAEERIDKFANWLKNTMGQTKTFEMVLAVD